MFGRRDEQHIAMLIETLVSDRNYKLVCMMFGPQYPSVSSCVCVEISERFLDPPIGNGSSPAPGLITGRPCFQLVDSNWINTIGGCS